MNPSEKRLFKNAIINLLHFCAAFFFAFMAYREAGFFVAVGIFYLFIMVIGNDVQYFNIQSVLSNHKEQLAFFHYYLKTNHETKGKEQNNDTL